MTDPWGAPADDADPFAGGDKVPSLSFKDKPEGTFYTGIVTEKPTMVQSRNFDTGEPDHWPDGKPKMSAVVRFKVGEEEFSIWAQKPSSMFTAIAEAQREAGARIEVGGTLTVKHDSSEANSDAKKNARKIYKAKYAPPAPKAAADPFEDSPPF